MTMWRAYFLILVVMLGLGVARSREIERNPDIDVVWEHVGEQPNDVGMACLALNGRYSPILYNATGRFPLASVSKLLIFIEYAHQVVEGRIGLSERVTLADLERYALPRTDRGAHERFIASYETRPETLSLWEVATTGMMTYSANTASDYLLARLGEVDWQALYARLGMSHTSAPHALTGIAFLMNNHEDGLAHPEGLEQASMTEAEAYLGLYVRDITWRTSEIVYRRQMRRLFPAWDVQAAFLQEHTATGTVEDFLRLMVAIYGDDSPLHGDVRELVRRALRVNGSTRVNRVYVEYGSKLGFYSGGVMALVAYGDAIEGVPVISVSFFRNIPIERYREMLEEDSLGDLAHFMHLNACTGLLDALLGR